MDFKKWYSEADIPQLVNGVWVDLETGIPFKNATTQRKTRKSVSIDALASRNIAKTYGGKALKGTPKQKEWAEIIRAEKLKYLSKDEATLVCDPNGLLNHSKFWIETCYDASGAEIALFIKELKSLLALAKELKAAGKADEYAKAAAAYNELTAHWGF